MCFTPDENQTKSLRTSAHPVPVTMAGTDTKLTPEPLKPSLFIPYITLGVNTPPCLLHIYPIKRLPLPSACNSRFLAQKVTKINSTKLKLLKIAVQPQVPMIQRPHFPESLV